jgi:putative acetyltransferase
VIIAVEDPAVADVRALLEEHLADMYSVSPPESVHALDLERLRVPAVTFWTVRENGTLLGCGALYEQSPGEGEIKSMRTARPARRRGVARAVLETIIEEARCRGYERLNLETGSQDFFAPARELYSRRGFTECGPFGAYTLDPNSVFMTLPLAQPH